MKQCSTNEIEAVLTKAARGRGADAGHASQFGRACVLCLSSAGDVDLINAALRDLPGGVIDEFAIALHLRIAGAIDKQVVFQSLDALQAGYIAALPYKISQLGETGHLVQLDAFEQAVKPARLNVDEGDLVHWQSLAARTFVPESEQSRLAGAGAGLTDND